MRYYVVDPDNDERLIKIPFSVRSRIVDEARKECADAVRKYATDRLDEIRVGGRLPAVPDPREDIVAALYVAADRIERGAP